MSDPMQATPDPTTSAARRSTPAERVLSALRVPGLAAGTILLLSSGDPLRQGTGLGLNALALLSTRPARGRLRALRAILGPVLLGVIFYGLLVALLHAPPEGAPTTFRATTALRAAAPLLARSMGILLALFALEGLARPFARRLREAGGGEGKVSLVLGLSYQLLPVFLESLEGILLAFRSTSRRCWLRPSYLRRGLACLFLVTHRLADELTLVLILRFRRRGEDGPG